MKGFAYFTVWTVLLGVTLEPFSGSHASRKRVPFDTYDLSNIPGPYKFLRFQQLSTGENIRVGGDGDFSYHSDRDGEFRSKVGDFDLNGVFFTSPVEGWVVGSEGSLLRTEDRGRNWTTQRSGVKTDLLAIVCINSARCWVTGEYGVVLTTDNAKDWRRLESGTKIALVAVDFLNGQVGLTVGRDLILKTSDGGVSWKEQLIMGGQDSCNGKPFSSGRLRLTGVTLFDESNAWVSADDGIARYISATGNWEGQCVSGAGPLAGVVSRNGKRVFAVGSNGRNVVSEDSGASWALQAPIRRLHR